MALTELEIKNLKGRDKPYKVADGEGMYVHVTPQSKKVFRMDFRHGGKRHTIKLGDYPYMTLRSARVEVAKIRELLHNGVNPLAERQLEKSKSKVTFGQVAEEWLDREQDAWSEGHLRHVLERLNKHILPALKDRPVAEIRYIELVKIVSKIAEASRDIAHRAASDIKRILIVAQLNELVEHNAGQNLTAALPRRPKQKNRPAITDVKQFGDLVRSINDAAAGPVNKTMLWLAPRLFLRPGDLRKMKWEIVDLENARINLTPEKTANSTEVDTIVPLAKQVVERLTELKKLTGEKPYVFYSSSSAAHYPSDNTMNKMLTQLGWPRDVHSIHGFRASAKTLLIEVLRFGEMETELQLSHQVKDMHGTAYNRVKLIDERTHMMQVWCDFIDRLIAKQDYDDLVQQPSRSST